MALYSPDKAGMLKKVCRQDIIEEQSTPKIKVCPKQKVLYKLAKSETVSRPYKKRKMSANNQWTLQNLHPPHAKSINVQLWSSKKQPPQQAETFIHSSSENMDYRPAHPSDHNEIYRRYQEIGLSSFEWTRHETDLLLTLCNQFNNRWPLIIDRYNACKPSYRPKRTIPQIKARYYDCKQLILQKQSKSNSNELSPIANNNNHNKDAKDSKQEVMPFAYDATQDEQRRSELHKLVQRTHDENTDLAQTAEAYRKHEKLLKKKIHDMHEKKMQLQKQALFIIHRQQMSAEQVQQMREENASNDDDGEHSNKNNHTQNVVSSHHLLPYGLYQGYGVLIQDTLQRRNVHDTLEKKEPDDEQIVLPSQCIPKRIHRATRHIQMIDDEYTRYKYELKLDANGKNGKKQQKSVIVVVPPKDAVNEGNRYDPPSSSKKKKGKNQGGNHNRNVPANELLSSSNPELGDEIAKRVQQELINENIIQICPQTQQIKMRPITNTTRSMLNVLREDYIKYYALQTMINDLKKKQKSQQK